MRPQGGSTFGRAILPCLSCAGSIEFIGIARPEDMPRLDLFYVSTNEDIRRPVQPFMLERLETVPGKTRALWNEAQAALCKDGID